MKSEEQITKRLYEMSPDISLTPLGKGFKKALEWVLEDEDEKLE
jgi:hypothetical protein